MSLKSKVTETPKEPYTDGGPWTYGMTLQVENATDEAREE